MACVFNKFSLMYSVDANLDIFHQTSGVHPKKKNKQSKFLYLIHFIKYIKFFILFLLMPFFRTEYH